MNIDYQECSDRIIAKVLPKYTALSLVVFSVLIYLTGWWAIPILFCLGIMNKLLMAFFEARFPKKAKSYYAAVDLMVFVTKDRLTSGQGFLAVLFLLGHPILSFSDALVLALFGSSLSSKPWSYFFNPHEILHFSTIFPDAFDEAEISEAKAKVELERQA